jgi:hypothetical protein
MGANRFGEVRTKLTLWTGVFGKAVWESESAVGRAHNPPSVRKRRPPAKQCACCYRQVASKGGPCNLSVTGEMDQESEAAKADLLVVWCGV